MKILQVLREVTKRGGIGRGVYELSSELAKRNDLHILTAKSQNFDGLRNDKGDIIPSSLPMIHSYWIPQKPFWLQIWYNAQQTRKFIEKNGGEYDIVASHDAESPICDILHKHSVYKQALNQQMVERGLEYAMLKRLDPRAHVVLGIEAEVVGNAKHIIAVSQAVKDQLLSNYSLPSDKITVVYNGVNTTEFHPDLKQEFRYKTRRAHGIGMEDKVMLFAGHEWERKGLRAVIEAMPLLTHPGIKLLVVGRGDADKYAKIARKAGVSQHVIFGGIVQNMREYYAAADLLVFPTHFEPFGLVITEAMASGLPVIITKHAGAAELITHMKDGLLLETTSKEEIAFQIEYAIGGNQQRLGEEARTTAEGYSWENQAKKIEEVYEKWKR